MNTIQFDKIGARVVDEVNSSSNLDGFSINVHKDRDAEVFVNFYNSHNIKNKFDLVTKFPIPKILSSIDTLPRGNTRYRLGAFLLKP